MTDATPAAERVTPIVLVGGRSTRFTRNKLIEPLDDGVLVARPIKVLREVFGPCVVVVGDADAAVLREGDAHLPDRYPLRGPAGGILTALEVTNGSVFVLAGDMPSVTSHLIRQILARAKDFPAADAIVAANGTHLDPLVGLYRVSAMTALRHSVSSDRSPPLQVTLASLHTERVDACASALVNVNHEHDLASALNDARSTDALA